VWHPRVDSHRGFESVPLHIYDLSSVTDSWHALGPVSAMDATDPLHFAHYEVRRREDGSSWELGRGAMGITYKAFDPQLRVEVALKVINPAQVRDARAQALFLREARAAARVHQSNVANVVYLSENPTNLFYAMEFIEGEALRDWLRPRAPLQPLMAIGLALQIARGLEAIHDQKVIHRDLKPSNLMVLRADRDREPSDSDPDAWQIKIIDFGLAKRLSIDFADTSDEAATLGFRGTALYASPEQCEERPNLDERTDLYSLGCLLWEMLVGTPPFRAGTHLELLKAHVSKPPPSEDLGGVPVSLATIVLRLLSKDPDHRFAKAGALVRALEHSRDRIAGGLDGAATRHDTLTLDSMTRGKGGTDSSGNMARKGVGRRARRWPLAAAVVVAGIVIAGMATRWTFGLRLAQTPSPKTSVDAARTLFERAKFLAKHSSSHLEGSQNNPRIISLLEDAVKADPSFAEAHADLALAYVIRLFLYAPEDKALEEKAYAEVAQALTLNANLPAAYLARGRLKWTPFYHFPHADAIQDFKHALALDPGLDEVHHYLGLVYLHVGLLDEGRIEFEAAIALNPSNNGAQYRLGETLLYAGKFREARNIFERTDADFNPDLKASHLGVTLLGLHQADDASKLLVNYLQQRPQDRGGLVTSVQAMVAAATGKYEEAEQKIQIASTRRGFGHFHHTEYYIASAYALMRKTELAVEWFERATTEGFNCYPMFERDVNLDKLRDDARFREIMEVERTKWETYKSKFGKSSV
jgi:serine/threonine protein kinase